MANGQIALNAGSGGKTLDTTELTVDAATVQREHTRLAGAADGELSVLKNTDPGGTDYGLVTREAGPISPQNDYATSAALAAGASVDLDGTTIGASKTGKLMQVTVGSSVPCVWVVKTRDGGTQVVLAVLYTGGLAGADATVSWKPSSKEMATLAGNGVDENFRVTVTNLSDAVAGDVHATIEWDEV